MIPQLQGYTNLNGKIHPNKNYTHMLVETLFTVAPKWKQFKYVSTDKCIREI